VSARLRYSADFRPPAPVLPVRVGVPGGDAGLALVALVDTGADLSVVPASVVRTLALPRTSTLRIRGVTGAAEEAPVHAAKLELGGASVLAEVVAWADEAIIGRDVLARFVLELHGPRETLTLTPQPPPTRRLKRVR
jgi:predicted aspartyl protease